MEKREFLHKTLSFTLDMICFLIFFKINGGKKLTEIWQISLILKILHNKSIFVDFSNKIH